MLQRYEDVEACVDLAIERVGKRIILGAPLGLGKPAELLNAFFSRAVADPSIELHIYTALSLELPAIAEGVEGRLVAPIVDRLFGGVVELDYMRALREDRLPGNVTVSEFYFKAGAMKSCRSAQRNYISSNYTHIARDIFNAGVNVLTQLVATREDPSGLQVSLSCNPDLALELVDRLRQSGREFVTLAQANHELPFMTGDAEVDPDTFAVLLEGPSAQSRLFAVPNTAVPIADYATGLHASSLVADGGTLQIGIGSLGDAVAQALIVRQKRNADYRNMLDAVTRITQADPDLVQDGSPFQRGLYVSTEMFINAMWRLIEAGIVKRRVYDDLHLQQAINAGQCTERVDAQLLQIARDTGALPRHLNAASLAHLQSLSVLDERVALAGDGLVIDGSTYENDTSIEATFAAVLATADGRPLCGGKILHGGFFLGPRDFYEALSGMSDALREKVCMTAVRRTNQLLEDPALYSAQRRHARFINTGMIVTLGGAVASDGLEDGTVISGVGGQYNFVAMAHDLPEARSVLCIRAARGQGNARRSNIVPHYGHTTIPRHLRDIVITEYGIADLRGQSDSEIAKRLICVADAQFQSWLIDAARKSGKIEPDWHPPASTAQNTPESLQRALAPWSGGELLPDFPFGTQLTDEELALAASLRRIKAVAEDPGKLVPAMLRALVHRADEPQAKPYLERLGLEHPDSSRDFIVQQLLLQDLEDKGFLKVS